MSQSVRTSEEDSLRILQAIAFYPRGGSAQVVRYLARALIDRGHTVQVVSGSLKESGRESDAEVFYEGIPLVEMDYAEAIRGFGAGLDPMSDQFAAPLAPSYEDKPGVPDRVFYRVGRREMRHLVESWRSVLAKVTDDFRPHVAHLHHLNHLHLAAASLATMTRTPKLAHLHGTELKMLEEMKTLSDPDGRVISWDENLRAVAREVAIATLADRAPGAIEAILDSLSTFQGQRRRLLASPHPWMNDALRDVIRGNPSLWRELSRVTRETPLSIETLVPVADNTIIDFPEESKLKALLDDAYIRKAHLEDGGKIGWGPFRSKLVKERIYVIKTIRVILSHAFVSKPNS